MSEQRDTWSAPWGVAEQDLERGSALDPRSCIVQAWSVAEVSRVWKELSDRMKIGAYLEIGKKRTFAGAIDWPGWSRSGRDEGSALQTLFEYGPRYERVLRIAQVEFRAPTNASAFAVVERLDGNATTDFGAPAIAPASDARPVDDAELGRFQRLLAACWQAFDEAVRAAAGKELRKGPRGGGRELGEIVQHVHDAEVAYLRQLGWQLKDGEGPNQEQLRFRHTVLKALTAAAHGELPMHGPRGGPHWEPRYFVRRTAWHALDHAWEIEDRITERKEKL